MKVRVGTLYTFDRNGADIFDGGHLHIDNGTVVRVINKRGCPPANTMGQCYIENAVTQMFYGMCDTRSLVRAS